MPNDPAVYKQRLNELLLTTAKQNASDLHLSVGRRPTLRIDGVLIGIQKDPILSPEDVEGMVMSLLNQEQRDLFYQEKQLDFAFSFEDKARFRCNVYFS